ncbi:MAG: Gfo/Idh/MocA family oxidoreductase [Sediminibacterium sp.]
MSPISTALLSFGMSGRLFHAPFLEAHPGFVLSAIWERNLQQAPAVYPGIRSVRRLEDILQDPTIELVVVNTPTATHFDYTRQVLMAGKHAIVEKAFTNTTEEAIELNLLAQERGCCLSVFQNRRYDSDFKTVEKMIQSGMLGTLLEAEFHFDRFKSTLSPKLHKELPLPGAGLLYDLGPHLIDQAMVLFGFPNAVFADIRTLRPESQVDDCFELLLYYPDLRVRLKSGYHYREPIPAYTLFGTKGSFHKSRADVQERDLLAGLSPLLPHWGIEETTEKGYLHTETTEGIIQKKWPSEKGNYMDYFEGIFQHIRNGEKIPVSAAEGIAIMRIIEAARLSSDRQQVVELD